MQELLVNTQDRISRRFKKMGFLGTYVESQWGLASFTVAAECACVCAFGPGHSVIGNAQLGCISYVDNNDTLFREGNSVSRSYSTLRPSFVVQE